MLNLSRQKINKNVKNLSFLYWKQIFTVNVKHGNV